MRMSRTSATGKRGRACGARRFAGRSAQGFSLIEVLVALVVTSIGLLGLAAMQLVALKQNYNAYSRSEAVQISHAIIESMRANRRAALTGDYDISFADPAPIGISVAARDLGYWRQRIAATLPDGTAAIDVDAITGTVTVVVRWDDARGEAGPENPAPGDALEFLVVTEL